jgi:CheY-like chemotaxis protein
MSDRQKLPVPSIGASGSLRNLRVLVVDDQEDARDLMAVVLEGAGAKVTLAESASVALRAVTESEFGILVSDIGMPEQDGYELIRRLRTGDAPARSRQIPAVAVTAFSAPDDRRKALEAGFQEHLPKPVDLIKLIDVVARLAADRGLAGGSGTPSR